ncbi:metalloprotease TldD [Azoarcus taiwanensis]|uniref:Metalloprotease TldD n=1 Tax=Azoarcus taiwanensis TaxID=666964 RepID=A0A972J9G5_9RHOO|nr:metalloprotease TldD [Azoarcus taiwanensis]NMG01372.1 metalloprotease TldD [Azoarcus taiwanensis]
MTHQTDALAIADRYLLDPNQLGHAEIERVFGTLLHHRLDYADLYFQYHRSEAWSLEEGIVKSGSFNIEQGVGVRAVSGDKTAFAYSDDISLPALTAAAEATRAIADAGGSGKAAATSRRRADKALYRADDPLGSLDDAAKVALLERLEGFARAEDPRVTQVMAHVAGTWEVVLVARSDGRLAADVRPLVRVSLSVIMEENGRREQGSAGGGGRFDYAWFDDERLREYARAAVHQARVNLGAGPAPAATMTVVLGPGWPGILLHEAIGHGLEGDFNRKGSSAFSGRIGQRVAAPGVTVVDDGTIADRRGSLTIDDEGNPTERTVLIEDGVLTGYMQDIMNARLMGVAPTGNGRRESYAHLPMPRMTNTYMLNGGHDPEEILRSVKKGLYAVNFGGGQVDITSGKFVFSTSEAYLIENGRVTRPVKGATLIGNGPDALTRVSMIGNDMALDPGVGTCGKEGQSVPVGVGQPTLRIDGLTVGGTA